MTDYRIICTNQVPIDQPTTHAHIVAVGTGDKPGDTPSKRWTLEEVIAAISAGDTFHTEDSKGNRAEVEVVDCPSCAHKIIRTDPDASLENNLDSLPICKAENTTNSKATSTAYGKRGNPPATPRLPTGRNVG